MDSRGLSNASPETAAWLSLIAYVRHMLTDYDELLMRLDDRIEAREAVRGKVNEVVERWSRGGSSR